MKPRPDARTTYTEEEWEDVAARLRKVRWRLKKSHNTLRLKEDRATLETMLRKFLEQTVEDSRHVDAGWKRLGKHLAAVHAELDGLAAQGVSLQWAEPWREFNREVLAYANRRAGRLLSPRRGSNRARGNAVDELVLRLLSYWAACGGIRNTSPTSASTLFVLAAAGPVIDLTGSAVVGLVRQLPSAYRRRD
jgi:hypothetical protein